MDERVVFFFVSALLWKVHSLKCITCIPDTSLNCTDTETDCPSGECVSLGVSSYTLGIKVNHIKMKFCSAAGQCPSGSINYGIVVSSYKSECCGTNLCNAREIPDVPLDSSKNGLKCFTCDGQSCASTVDCLGDENRCIKSAVSAGDDTMILKGCASESICGVSQSSMSLPNIYTSSACCEGSLCNNAKRPGLSLSLFLMTLSLIVLNPLNHLISS